MIHRLTLAVVTALLSQGGATGQSPQTPAEALQTLETGNWRFASDNAIRPPLGEGVRRTLQGGESPFAIVVTCADSRVPPEHVFNVGLGELYVIRVAGNVCDPETLASIEYAAGHLGASLCVVMSHRSCSTVATAADHSQARSPALSRLLERIQPALARAHREGLEGHGLLDRTEVENTYETIAECQRRSPLLRELVRLERLDIVGARYDLESGKVEWLPRREVSEEAPKHEEPAEVAPASMPPHVALAMLQAGHRRFLSGAGQAAELGSSRRGQLLHGQNPFAVVLTCSDSRVAPEHIFDVGLGELYVIRVAGNVVSDEALASIEYAVSHLGASVVMAMGHQSCNALSAAIEGAGSHHTISMHELLARLEPSVAAARHEGYRGAALSQRAVERNAVHALNEIRQRSKLISQLEEQGRIGMLATSYQLDSGELHWLRDEPDHPSIGAIVHEPETTAHASDHGHQAHAGAHGHGTEDHDSHGHDAHGGHEARGAVAHTDHAHGQDSHGHDAHGHGQPMGSEHVEFDAAAEHLDPHEVPAAPGGSAPMPSQAKEHALDTMTLLIAAIVAVTGVGFLLVLRRRSRERTATS